MRPEPESSAPEPPRPTAGSRGELDPPAGGLIRGYSPETGAGYNEGMADGDAAGLCGAAGCTGDDSAGDDGAGDWPGDGCAGRC
jgi:hypothetical protein